MTTNSPSLIRWGILSTGFIAEQFVQGLKHAPGSEAVAVGSRSQKTANKFGRKYKIEKRYDSYVGLAADPDVDIIYIGTPHPYHFENAMMCLDAGKHVLLEKPFTVNAGEARQLIAKAREKKLFLMEAMWTRFFPIIKRMNEVIEAGTIGEIATLTGGLYHSQKYDPKGRHFALELGGGALLDVGIYPLSFTWMLMGRPDKVSSMAYFGETGADYRSSYTLLYEDKGVVAFLGSSVSSTSPAEFHIGGTRGSIRIHEDFFRPDTITVHEWGKKRGQVIKEPYKGNGYQFEAIHVAQCIRDGKTESEVVPLDESLMLMELMDAIRAEWGLKYPGER